MLFICGTCRVLSPFPLVVDFLQDVRQIFSDHTEGLSAQHEIWLYMYNSISVFIQNISMIISLFCNVFQSVRFPADCKRSSLCRDIVQWKIQHGKSAIMQPKTPIILMHLYAHTYAMHSAAHMQILCSTTLTSICNQQYLRIAFP